MATDETPANQPSRLPGWRTSLVSALLGGRFLKGLALAALLAGFAVSLELVAGLVQEREWMGDIARDAVAGLWGPAQQLTGPLLIVPEDRVTGSGADIKVEAVRHVLAPRDLAIDVAMSTETRRRGLFDVPVYTAAVTLTGRFDPGDLSALPGNGVGIVAPVLAASVSSAAAIVGNPAMTWNGVSVAVTPEPPAAAKAVLGPQAIAAPLPAIADDGRFTLKLQMRGTGRFMLAPSGRSTSVAMTSSWPDPSFVGSRTAESHSIGADGFRANWRVGPFGRNAPSAWTSGTGDSANPVDALRAEGFGVALIQPVDPYRMTERALKYGMLFALYTFGAFVVMEGVFRRPLHTLHYLLTGASVATFFLLLLSLSELTGFVIAYAIGAAAVVLQTGLYARSILGERRLWLGFAGLLAGLYGGLFGLLHLEETAPVTGSVALFAAIGVAMVLTRRLTAHPAMATSDTAPK